MSSQCIVVTMVFDEAAIVLFCQELKTLGDFTYSNSKGRVTQNIVIGVTHELFTNVISPDSKKHEASMCNFNSLGKHIFQSNEMWIYRDLVKSVCDLIAKYEGWDASLHQKK